MSSRTNKALLIIGDKNKRYLDPSFRDFIRHVQRLNKKNIPVYIRKYKDVLDDKLPDINCKTLDITLFFPFAYWNKHIEIYQNRSKVYGDKQFGSDYKTYFTEVERHIRRKYRGKSIRFVNPPSSSTLERDKKASKLFFKKNALPTPRSYTVNTARKIRKLLTAGLSLYIKPRFGAMGKGITFLSEEEMVTNFKYRAGRIISPKHDYNWNVNKVKQQHRDEFLNHLLSRDFICEEAISSPVYRGRRVDFRVYCIYGKVPYLYARSAPIHSFVTNWSQGGRIEKRQNMLKYVKASDVKKIKSLAFKVAKSLKLNYAGIDIILDKKTSRPYVLEAHSFPGYEKGFDLMQYLAKQILTGRIT